MFADTAMAAVLTHYHVLLGDDHEITKLIFTTNDGKWAKYRDAFAKWMTVM